LAVSAAVGCEPLAANVPLQPPEAVQEVALLDDQVNVVLPPDGTVLGLALIEAVGGALDRATVTDWDPEPPAPVQVSMYVVVADMAAVT